MSSHTEVSTVAAADLQLKRRARTWLYIGVVLSYLIVKVTHLHAFGPVLSVLSLIAILVSLPSTTVIPRTLSILMLGGGTWMLLHKGVSVGEYISAFGDMAYLLALFAVLPVLSVPVNLGGYTRAIQSVLHGRVTTVFQLNVLVSVLAYICGSFMSLAAIPVMMTSMEPVVANYPIRHKKRFMAVAAICGYVLPILWTPMSGMVGVVVRSLHVEWITVFPALFGLSIAILLVNWAVFYFLELRGSQPASEPAANASHAATSQMSAPWPKLMQMVVAIVLLIVCVTGLDNWARLGLVTMVTLVGIPFAFAWSAMIGKGKPFFFEMRWQLLTRLPRMSDQFAIFLCAGFFVQALHMSGIDHTVNQMFVHLHDKLGTELFLLSMPVMALIASFIGIHPLVLMALLGESMKPEIIGVPASQLAIVLVGSAVLTYMQGPFSGTLGLVQSINQVPGFRLSLWTAPYAAAYLVLLAIVILLGIGG
jgi:hypothetical protein